MILKRIIMIRDPSELYGGICLKQMFTILYTLACCAVLLGGTIAMADTISSVSNGTDKSVNETVVNGTIDNILTLGYLEVRGSPDGARVYFDGVYMGYINGGILKVPFDTHAKRAWKDFSLEYTGYKTFTGSLPTVEAGKTVSVSANMNKDTGYQETGQILFKSSPAGAELKVRNVSYGKTPDSGVLLIHNVPTGYYLIEAVRPGNKTYASYQTIGENARLYFEISLKPAPTGNLSVNSTPEGAGIYIDNKYIGLTPLVIPDVANGHHEIILKKELCKDWVGNTTIEGGDTKEVNATLVYQPETVMCDDQ